MPNSTLKLILSTQSYKIFDTQSFVICDVTDKQDKDFHLQIRFLQKDLPKINLSFLLTKLKSHITKLTINNKLFFKDDNKIAFLNDLKKLDFDLDLTEIIHNKCLYKINNNRLVKEYNENKINLFCIDRFSNYRLGYEIPKTISKDYNPLCCAQFYNKKQLIKKVYLFPFNEASLNRSTSILKNNNSRQVSLEIPYVEYYLSLSEFNTDYNNEIQTRINLQVIISEALVHLGKQNYFRKNGSRKAAFFNTLAQDIANNTSLDVISNQLNHYDVWRLLAQHRDPWGFFSFFKGKTYSLMTWEVLREEIAKFNSVSSPPTLSP